MPIATLSIDLEAKLASFAADMGKAVRISEQSAGSMAAALGLIGSAARGLVGVTGVSGIVALGKASIDSLDALNDLADATGASVENISALEDVAARTGSSMDSVAASLVKFNSVLKDAKPGSEAEAALKAINLNVKELQALDPAEALHRSAVALAGFADDGNKARLVQELFGKSVREVAPFLKDLADQGSLVAKVTGEQAREAEKFNKQLLGLQKNTQDLTRALASDLVTSINAAADAFRTSGLLEGFRTLVTGTDQFKNDKALAEQTELKLNLERAITEFRKEGYGDDSRVITNAKAQLAGINEQLRLTLSYRKVLAEFGKQGTPIGPLPSVPALVATDRKVGTKKTFELSDTAARRYIESLEESIRKTSELTEEEAALAQIRKLGTVSLDDAARILGRARELDEARALIGIRKQDLALGEERNKQAAEYAERLHQNNLALGAGRNRLAGERADKVMGLLDATPSAEIERQRTDMKLLTEEFRLYIDTAGQAGISEAQYLEAVTARLGLTGDAVVKARSITEELGLTFSSAFEDAIVGGSKLSDVLKGLQQDLLRLVVRRTITEPLGATLTASLESLNIGGLFGSLFGGFFGGFRAEGGDISAGKAYMVGERGPEMILAGRSGTVIPNHKLGSVPPVQNVYNIHIDSRSDRAQIQSDLRRIMEANNEQIAEKFRRHELYG